MSQPLASLQQSNLPAESPKPASSSYTDSKLCCVPAMQRQSTQCTFDAISDNRSADSCRCVQMYVSMAKRKILECLDLPAETLSLLTSNDKETNLHAVPLWSVTLKSMARLLKHYKGRYTTVVGFQPTGWTQKQGVVVG